MKMNIIKKVFCFYYLLNKGKWNDRTDSIGLAFGGTGFVLIINQLTIIFILKICGIVTFSNKFLLYGGGVIIYSVLAIYFFGFKHYKIVDEEIFKKYSPWKKPVIFGGVYLLLSLFVCILVIWLIPVD